MEHYEKHSGKVITQLVIQDSGAKSTQLWISNFLHVLLWRKAILSYQF